MRHARRRALLDAPSNLGLRPPGPGMVPGCYKLGWALREQGLRSRLDTDDAGVVVPPRYDRGAWKPGDGVFNAASIASFTRRLADRVGGLLDEGRFPIVLGGDCSILLGSVLALRRRGRYGVAFVDGHSDFRHVGIADHVGAAAGEDLALATGRGHPDLVALDDLAPYTRDTDLEILGIRDNDAAIDDLATHGIPFTTVHQLRTDTPERTTTKALAHLESRDLDGFWLHLDADVLDPSVMPAVDSPDPNGLHPEELIQLLHPLATSTHCKGIEITIFDPDLDPDGYHATTLVDLLEHAMDE